MSNNTQSKDLGEPGFKPTQSEWNRFTQPLAQVKTQDGKKDFLDMVQHIPFLSPLESKGVINS